MRQYRPTRNRPSSQIKTLPVSEKSSAPISFATYCYHRDIQRVHSPSFLQRLVGQHNHNFCEVLLIEQNCAALEAIPITGVSNLKIVRTEDYPSIYSDYNIVYPNTQAEIFYDGPNDPHYWPKHTQNLLIAGKVAIGEYILFSDNDVTIERNVEPGWVNMAISCLNKYPEVLVVCPGDGRPVLSVPEGCHTDIMSQQIFLARASRFREINFDIPFPYTRTTVPTKYTPAMPQYHFMAEGRIGRYMIDNNLRRLMLDCNRWRYWHHNPCGVTMFDLKPLK